MIYSGGEPVFAMTDIKLWTTQIWMVKKHHGDAEYGSVEAVLEFWSDEILRYWDMIK